MLKNLCSVLLFSLKQTLTTSLIREKLLTIDLVNNRVYTSNVDHEQVFDGK